MIKAVVFVLLLLSTTGLVFAQDAEPLTVGNSLSDQVGFQDQFQSADVIVKCAILWAGLFQSVTYVAPARFYETDETFDGINRRTQNMAFPGMFIEGGEHPQRSTSYRGIGKEVSCPDMTTMTCICRQSVVRLGRLSGRASVWAVARVAPRLMPLLQPLNQHLRGHLALRQRSPRHEYPRCPFSMTHRDGVLVMAE